MRRWPLPADHDQLLGGHVHLPTDPPAAARAPDRIACATAVVGGLALGDPTGTHLLLDATDVAYRRGTSEPELRVDWSEVRALDVDAPTARSRRPGAVAVLLAATAEAVGLPWAPGIAPVTVTLVEDDGATDLECDGYVGPGYWAPHLAALEAATHVWVAHPGSRAVLGRPTQALADLDAVAGAGPGPARAGLAEAWGTVCSC